VLVSWMGPLTSIHVMLRVLLGCRVNDAPPPLFLNSRYQLSSTRFTNRSKSTSDAISTSTIGSKGERAKQNSSRSTGNPLDSEITLIEILV
jgi:hypothetical protein